MAHTHREIFRSCGSLATLTICLGALLAGCSQEGAAEQASDQQYTEDKPRTAAEGDNTMSMTNPSKAYVLHHEIEMIDGETRSLEEYKGSVLMLVNVASKCGYTKQYEQLEEIYRQYKDRGFVVIGFPANNFGAQEPGTNEEIAEFCSSTFDVTFPMAAKISVKGDDTHPLYKQLAEQELPVGGEPGWNFTKFLVARDGQVVERVDTKVSPDDPEVLASIEQLLGTD
jgi:glutathione peroxidase